MGQCIPYQKKKILYHGTSHQNALYIQRVGFKESKGGCLGQGVYLAQEDKATRFALDTSRTGKQCGAVLKCKVKYRRIKKQFKNAQMDDNSWRNSGYDAVKVTKTNLSRNPEWVMKDKNQVEILDVQLVGKQGGDCKVCNGDDH